MGGFASGTKTDRTELKLKMELKPTFRVFGTPMLKIFCLTCGLVQKKQAVAVDTAVVNKKPVQSKESSDSDSSDSSDNEVDFLDEIKSD